MKVEDMERREDMRDEIERLKKANAMLADALEHAKPVFSRAVDVALEMKSSGEPWTEAMAQKMRDVVQEWCDEANAALSAAGR